MKIGYLVQNLDKKTGGGRFAANIIEGITARGHEVVVLKESHDEQEGNIVLRRGWRIFFCVPQVRKLLKDCDVIHAIDGYPFGIIAWLANRKLHKKLIISALGTYAVAPLYRWPFSYLLKRAYLSAYKVVPISNFTEQEILDKVNLKNSKVINPGIEIGKTLGKIQSDKKFILGVGGIKERKGYHVALSAFAVLSKQFPDLHYVLVGDEDVAFQTVLNTIVSRNNLKDRVEFLHRISDQELEKLYRSAELFILTPINTARYHFEGYGLVFLEAARAGLPVIGTRGNGGEDAIKEGYNGLLVDQGDITSTAGAIISILSNPEKRASMGKASIEWARFNTVDREVEKLIEVYKNS